MKIKAFTPKGKVILDLTVAKDIKTFGGQDAVDKHLHDIKVGEEMHKMGEARVQVLEGN